VRLFQNLAKYFLTRYWENRVFRHCEKNAPCDFEKKQEGSRIFRSNLESALDCFEKHKKDFPFFWNKWCVFLAMTKIRIGCFSRMIFSLFMKIVTDKFQFYLHKTNQTCRALTWPYKFYFLLFFLGYKKQHPRRI